MFPILETEPILQVNDKTRLDASKSYGAEFAKVEIAPNGVDFIDCTDGKFLDWSFDTPGTKTIKLRATSGSGSEETSKEISKDLAVISSESDALFSNDEDLKQRESDIFRYLRDGRASFLDKHRAAKLEILQDLKNDELISLDAVDLTGLAINPGALRDWSKYLTLSIIYFDADTGYAVGGSEYVKAKAESYRNAALRAKALAVRGLDANGDNVPDAPINIYSCTMVRS